MTKILKKDIENICNCIQSISWEYIKESEKHCFGHNMITWFNIKPYTCEEICFFFYRDDYKISLTACNKEEMYIKLLEVYEKGLNSWIESYTNDSYKTKREKHRLNWYKKKFIELNKVVDICYS